MYQKKHEGVHDRNLPSPGISNSTSPAIKYTYYSSTTAFKFIHLVSQYVLHNMGKTGVGHKFYFQRAYVLLGRKMKILKACIAEGRILSIRHRCSAQRKPEEFGERQDYRHLPPNKASGGASI